MALIISFVQRGSATSRSAKVSGTPRIPKKIKLDRNGKIIIYSFLGFVIFLGLVIPISVLSFWLFRGIYHGNDVSSSLPGIFGSFSAAIVTSIFAIIISMPIVILISQYKSKFGDILEKLMLLSLIHI